MNEELINYALFENSVLLMCLLVGITVCALIARNMLTKENLTFFFGDETGVDDIPAIKVCFGALLVVAAGFMLCDLIRRIMLIGQILLAPSLFLLDK